MTRNVHFRVHGSVYQGFKELEKMVLDCWASEASVVLGLIRFMGWV